MMHSGVTHIGVATDHVIESFRNNLWADYKTGEGVEPDLLSQFPILEEVLSAAGIVVWPMVEFEADDALASAAALALKDPRVEQVVICTPDKDLSQCVQASRVVQLIRRTGVTIDEAGVIAKFGVSPESIPDYLALVGDSADGYPGLPGWGAKSTAAVLAKFRHIESIPESARDWHANVLNSDTLAATLVPDDLLVTATCPGPGGAEGEVVMGVRHRSLPLQGVQFHPESVLSEHGIRLVANFLGMAR